MSWIGDKFREACDWFNKWWDGPEKEAPAPPHKPQITREWDAEQGWHDARQDWAERVKRREPGVIEL